MAITYAKEINMPIVTRVVVLHERGDCHNGVQLQMGIPTIDIPTSLDHSPPEDFGSIYLTDISQDYGFSYFQTGNENVPPEQFQDTILAPLPTNHFIQSYHMTMSLACNRMEVGPNETRSNGKSVSPCLVHYQYDAVFIFYLSYYSTPYCVEMC